jgi:hypothetical protein
LKAENDKFVKKKSMGKFEKLIEKILIGKSDQNIDFNELVNLLLKLEFQERKRQSSHIL